MGRLKNRIFRENSKPSNEPENQQPDENYIRHEDEDYIEDPQSDQNFQNVGGGYQQPVDVPPPPSSPYDVPYEQPPPPYQQPVPPPYEQPSGLPPQYYSTTYAKEQYDYQNPLAILDEIKKRPTPKGAKAIMIGGRPLDLHILEDYVVKVSPYHLRTILRYHNARTIEEIKNYSQRFGGKGMKMSTIILILLVIGMGVLGVVLMLFLPDIMAMFQGGAGIV